MTVTVQKVHYLISVTLDAVWYDDYETSTLATASGGTAWLGYSGGWPQITENADSAHEFGRVPALAEIMEFSGFPWYYKFQPESVVAHEIVTNIMETKTWRVSV